MRSWSIWRRKLARCVAITTMTSMSTTTITKSVTATIITTVSMSITIIIITTMSMSTIITTITMVKSATATTMASITTMLMQNAHHNRVLIPVLFGQDGAQLLDLGPELFLRNHDTLDILMHDDTLTYDHFLFLLIDLKQQAEKRTVSQVCHSERSVSAVEESSHLRDICSQIGA